MTHKPAARRFHCRADRLEPFDRRVALSAREHTVHPAADQRLHGCRDVAGHVEGPVAGDRERTRRLDQRPHARFVDLAVGRQAADHDTVDAEPSQRPHVGQHRGELDVGVEEVSAARADDHVERDRGEPPRLLDHAPAGREPALEERRAKLDPVSPRPLRGDEAVGVLDADLDRDQAQAAFALRGERRGLPAGSLLRLAPQPDLLRQLLPLARRSSAPPSDSRASAPTSPDTASGVMS